MLYNSKSLCVKLAVLLDRSPDNLYDATRVVFGWVVQSKHIEHIAEGPCPVDL